jgi:hypothetical protein
METAPRERLGSSLALTLSPPMPAFAGVGSRRVGSRTTPGESSWPARSAGRTRRVSGGGGNRTRVRGRTARASTSLSYLRISPGRLVVGNRPSGPAILRCRTSGNGFPSVPSPLNDAASRATGPARERRASLLVKQRERVRCCCSHLRLFPVFYEASGTSACSSAGEPTTSKPGRPRMWTQCSPGSQRPRGLAARRRSSA